MKDINKDKITTEEVDETKKEQVTNSIDYTGRVSISIRHGNKVIKKLDKKNSGGAQLFKFLGMAMAGTYIENFRPYKLLLGNVQLNEGTHKYELTNASVLVSINRNPTGSLLDNKSGYTITYHFLVPYSAITTADTEINSLILYNAESTLSSATSDTFTAADYCAWVELDESFQVSQEDIRKGFNMIIDWTLELTNKQVKTTSN